MASLKNIRGTTPGFTITFRDPDDNSLIDPSTEYTEIKVLLYNMKDGVEVAKFTTESPTPEGYEAITVTSEYAEILSPAAITEVALSGDNRIEVWTTDTGGDIDCKTGVFNEFIDAKDVV